MRVEISVISGPVKGKYFVFDRPLNYLFGRSTDAHISVPDAFVSRHHFALNLAPSECRLRDLDSKNGVIVNGVRYGGRLPATQNVRQAPINEVRLRDGDEIVVGTTRMTISIKNEARPQPSPQLSPQAQSFFDEQELRQTLVSRIAPQPAAPQPPKKSSTTSQTQHRQVALLVLDVAGSTQHVVRMGDSRFMEVIQEICNRVKQHPFASDVVLLKGTGDGFVALFHTVEIALSVAKSFLEMPPAHPDVHVRMGLHWGSVKITSQNDVIGMELHKAARLEGIQLSDRLAAPNEPADFPVTERILLTEQAMQELPDLLRKQCRPVGLFRLKDLEETARLWVWHPAIPAKASLR